MVYPLYGAFVKATEVVLFFPFHHSLHKSQTKSGLLNYKDMYKGIQYQIVQAPLNRYVDLHIYKKYGSSLESSAYSTLFKSITYPLQTAEVYYQLNNKLPKRLNNYYKGFSPYIIINASAYYIWFSSLKFYDKYTPKYVYNDNIHNAVVGFLSGMTVDLVMHPLKTIKVNLQSNKFKLQDVSMKYLSRGVCTKMLLSSLQSAYFNVFCSIKQT